MRILTRVYDWKQSTSVGIILIHMGLSSLSQIPIFLHVQWILHAISDILFLLVAIGAVFVLTGACTIFAEGIARKNKIPETDLLQPALVASFLSLSLYYVSYMSLGYLVYIYGYILLLIPESYWFVILQITSVSLTIFIASFFERTTKAKRA